MNNSVTIFSNGQAHLRVYKDIDEETNISLPFRVDAIEDVLASFDYFGNVHCTKSPSFTPPNKKKTINIDPNSPFTSLLTNRSGAKISFKRGINVVNGINLGIDTVNQETSTGSIIPQYFLSVLSDNGIDRIPLSEVVGLKFTESEIHEEILKSLAQNRQKIKPDSVFFNFTLKPKGSNREKALLQWVEQLSPWKLSYRLSSKEDSTYTFDIFGVVHNTTDTDWNDTILCLVNGKPATFISDLDERQEVQRNKVNVTELIAKGGHIPESGIPFVAAAPVNKNSRMSAAKCSMPALESCGSNYLQSDVAGIQATHNTQAVSEEVGDFCLYTQKNPISIPANTSTTIHLDSLTFKNAKQVLVFDKNISLTRPQRAIKVENETEQSLGMGVCVILDKGLFQGKCILPASKPNESRMLYYAEETGVVTLFNQLPREERRSRIRVANNTAVTECRQFAKSTYRFSNVKNEPFNLLIEHYNVIPNSTLEFSATLANAKTDVKVVEELGKSTRCFVVLPAKSEIQVEVAENYLNSTSFNIACSQDYFFTLLQSNSPIGNDSKIKPIILAKKKIDELMQEINAKNTLIAESEIEKDNLISILELGANAGNITGYQADLQNVVNTVRTENNNIKSLQVKLNKAKTDLTNLLTALSGDWVCSDQK